MSCEVFKSYFIECRKSIHPPSFSKSLESLSDSYLKYNFYMLLVELILLVTKFNWPVCFTSFSRKVMQQEKNQSPFHCCLEAVLFHRFPWRTEWGLECRLVCLLSSSCMLQSHRIVKFPLKRSWV